jgi:phosphate acetyltransferase
MLSNNPVECPKSLLKMAQAYPPVRTAIVSAGAHLPMASAEAATKARLIEPVFFGRAEEIKKQAAMLGWDISEYELYDATDEMQAAELAAEAASTGNVSSLMKGDIHTDVFLKKLLNKQWGLRTGHRLTHIFYMSVVGHERGLMITDGAVNVQPDFETSKSIVSNAAILAQALGIAKPNVAILSATEEPSIAIPSSIHASNLAKWTSENIDNVQVCGPLAFDLAVSPEAARIKKIDHPVAGNADIIVVPDIVTGNALFKMMVYFMGACAAGIVLGAKVPIILTSRADPPEARLASAALASIISQNH